MSATLRDRQLPPGLTLLVKPFRRSELRAKVQEVLGGQPPVP